MKELLSNLETIHLNEAQGFTLLDTCAFIHYFEHPEKARQLKEELKKGKYAITSFNIEELIHVEHKLNKRVKEEIRKFLKQKEDLEIINVNVHPGDRFEEISFIQGIEPELLKVLHGDYSDGILFATALAIKGNIITRDKHDLYNQIGEQFANKHKIEIRNKI